MPRDERGNDASDDDGEGQQDALDMDWLGHVGNLRPISTKVNISSLACPNAGRGTPCVNTGDKVPTSDDIRVMLTRMEGKQDLTNANLSHLSSLTDERHAIVLGEIKRLDTVDAKQGDRISEVEKSITQRNGALLGMQISGKVALVLTGAVPTGLLMIALKYLFA